jgi:hypothetical protein
VKKRELKKQLALMLCLVMIISVINPFFVLAEEAGPYDDLATENIERLYAAYLDSGGVLYKTSLEGIDPYHMFILKEADVDVAIWSYNNITLEDRLLELIDETKTKESTDPISAKAVAYQYLAAVALEEDGLADELLEILLQRHLENNDGTFFNGGWNQWTNLPVFDALAKTGAISDVKLDISAQYLLELQTDNGSFGDFMSTTQAMRALAGLKKNIPDEALNTEIETAIQQAVDWVKTTIQEDGSFFETSWDDPITNTAEVILTLAGLKKDLNEWKHGTTGKGPTDYLATIDSFGSQNAGSNAWALEAYLLLGAKPVFSPDDIGDDPGINPDARDIRVRIEGRESTLFDEIVQTTDSTGIDVLITAIGEEGIVFSNGLIIGLLGETALWEDERTEYWGLYTVADNALMAASVGINDLSMDDAVEMLLHFKDGYITKDTVIDVITTGASTKIIVSKIDEVWTLDPETGEWESASSQVAVQGATVSIIGKSLTTDENGEVTVNLEKGKYSARVEKQGTTYPELIRHEVSFEVEAAPNSGGGSSGGTTVHTTVTGKNGQKFYSGYMTLTSSDRHGITPVGALHKTGLSYDYDSLNFIHTINGLTNEGLNGWMYRVNGVVPPVSATSYTLRADDRLEWFYSTDSANLVGSAGAGLAGAAGTLTADLEKIRKEAADWIISQTVFDVYDSFNDWDAFALVRTGREVPDSYLETLNQHITDQQGSFRLVTDYARTILALSALGKDAGSVSGYHLLDSLINHERMLAQGINGPAYTLLALDAIDYMIPDDARWNRESLLEWMLDQQKRDGGFSLDQNPAAPGDVDITAVVLQAFSRYQDDAAVKAATEKAVKWLINQPMNSTESVAQTMIALSVLQLDLMEEMFIREENSLLDQLTHYHNTDGGFAHTLGGGSDQLATQQALMALTAYERYLNEAPDLFNLKEIDIEQEEQTAVTEEPVTVIVLADEAHISAWALEWVKKAVAYGLMSGVSAEELRFDPQRELTRAEFAVLMAKLHEADMSLDETAVFQDVQPGSWYYGHVMTARKNGWMSGVSGDTFAPHRSISRQEMAVVLAKALMLTAENEMAQPTDLDEAAEWAKEPVDLVYQHRLMVGDGQRFMPRSVVTREMAAVIMVKLYEDHLMP